MNSLRNLTFVAAGGAVGTSLRAAGFLAFSPAEGGFPWITLSENLLGAFLLGLLLTGALRHRPDSAFLRLFLGAGVLGSFTTFSAFAVDLVALPMAGRPAAAAGYLALSVGGGLAAAALGLYLGRGRTGPRTPREGPPSTPPAPGSHST
ncbi:MAG: CrcB family protein [Gemmatimonadales bacterium]|nr:MAG: CrcB family protein [Gemmatimonadales bacterium]